MSEPELIVSTGEDIGSGWLVVIVGGTVTIEAPGHMTDVGEIDNEKYARLFGAAPDMLTALKQLLAETNPKRRSWHLAVSSEGREMARAAIAKAEGNDE